MQTGCEPVKHFTPPIGGRGSAWATIPRYTPAPPGSGEYSLQDLAKKACEQGFRFRKSRGKVPVTTLHKVLRKRIYTGDFDYAGVRYQGSHEPLVEPCATPPGRPASCGSASAILVSGGESGIRTHVRVSPKHAFQACAFNHSAISPVGEKASACGSQAASKKLLSAYHASATA